MRNIKIIALGLILIITSCSNPNSEFIEKVKQKVKEDANGVEMNYRNISFEWIDTLFVKTRLTTRENNYEERLNAILGLEHFAKDNYKRGKIFSKNYLTKTRFEEIRNWENKIRGIPFNREYDKYYEFALANRGASEWISELCDQIEETDELLEKYESLEEGNLQLLQNVLWYYDRMDVYYSNDNPDKIWSRVASEFSELKDIKQEIDSLSAINPERVIYYKALNTFKINNPLLNGAEQELSKYFLFDSDFKIIGIEDYKN